MSFTDKLKASWNTVKDYNYADKAKEAWDATTEAVQTGYTAVKEYEYSETAKQVWESTKKAPGDFKEGWDQGKLISYEDRLNEMEKELKSLQNKINQNKEVK